MESWQEIWDNDRKGRGYYTIKKSVRVKKNISKYRKEEVAFSRLRLGHTSFNSTLVKMKKTLTDKCDVCKCKETVEHMLLCCCYGSSTEPEADQNVAESNHPAKRETETTLCAK